MSDLLAFIYGFIQGITEFLPISSSGHLALLPHFFHIDDPGVFFDLAMHIGTALAITCYFYKDIFDLLKILPELFTKRHCYTKKHYFLMNMIIAVGATGILFIFLKSLSEHYARNPKLIAINLILFGVILFISDFFSQENDKLESQGSWKIGLFIGLVQTLAIFPGVSRSGITMTMARFFKVSRFDASRFSFLLALPPIYAGVILKYQELDHIVFSWKHLFIGTGVSFVVAIMTIHFFLKWINQIGLKIFLLYRLILGGLIIYMMT